MTAVTATRWPEVRCRRGVVASPHVLASQAGLAAFERGGNAVDAALAAAITIAVVYPHMNGVGGTRPGARRSGPPARPTPATAAQSPRAAAPPRSPCPASSRAGGRPT